MSGTIYVRNKTNEKFLKMNGIKAKVYNGVDHNQNVECVSLPEGTMFLDSQVAGHAFGDGKTQIGMLKDEDGNILKPLQKTKGEKEIKFYTDLQSTTDPTLIQLKKFIPQFKGIVTLRVNDKDVEFLAMEDVAKDFTEPCIMDIKIGRQTWEPGAPTDKIEHEKTKYVNCRRDLGFCIPGFQIYRVSTGKVLKFGKEYGKKLTKDSVLDALKLFLNADCGLNRKLVMQILAKLWKILHWFRTQRHYKFYSSSLLLIYDTKRLRQCLKAENGFSNRPMSPMLKQENVFTFPTGPTNPVVGRAQSLKLNIGAGYMTNGNGLHSPSMNGINGSASPAISTPSTPDRTSLTGFKLDRPRTLGIISGLSRSSSFASSPSTTPSSGTSLERTLSNGSWHSDFETVCRTHSLVNNYEKDLQSMKDSYKFDLDELMSDDKPGSKELWARVRMIDFVHTIPSTDSVPDYNYLEGLENLVKLFETLLSELPL